MEYYPKLGDIVYYQPKDNPVPNLHPLAFIVTELPDPIIRSTEDWNNRFYTVKYFGTNTYTRLPRKFLQRTPKLAVLNALIDVRKSGDTRLAESLEKFLWSL